MYLSLLRIHCSFVAERHRIRLGCVSRGRQNPRCTDGRARKKRRNDEDVCVCVCVYLSMNSVSKDNDDIYLDTTRVWSKLYDTTHICLRRLGHLSKITYDTKAKFFLFFFSVGDGKLVQRRLTVFAYISHDQTSCPSDTAYSRNLFFK